MKNIKIIGITLIIIVVIILSLVYFTSSKNGMISGLEASSLAEPYAKEWNESAVLVSITANDFGGEPTALDENGGLFEEWFFLYSVQRNIGDSTSAIHFKVSSNGTVIEQFQINSSAGYEYEGMISNWTIDSDEAYNIAVSHGTVKSWKQDHPNAELMLFGSNSDKTSWSISWNDKTDGNLGFITAYIDAITGEIIVRS